MFFDIMFSDMLISLSTRRAYFSVMQMEDSSQLIEANGDESVSRGTGPWISISFPCFGASNCLGSFCRHDFSRTCIFLDFPEFFSFEYTHIFGNNIYHSNERAFHNSLVASHHP